MALALHALELLRVPGSERGIRAELTPAELGIEDPRLGDRVDVDLVAVSSIDDIDVRGTVTLDSREQCRRCLRPLDGDRTVDFDERYSETPTAQEVFPIDNGRIDLDQAIRETVLLALDDAPLCRPDCPGLCPVCGADLATSSCSCDQAEVDDRWAALDQLRGVVPDPDRPDGR